MPRVPEKIDDWTPPWGDGQLDPEQAKRLLYNALLGEQKAKDRAKRAEDELSTTKTSLEDAETKLADKPKDESAKDATINELTAKVRKLEREGLPTDKALIQRLEVALDHGLTKRDARRLVGDTLEELEEDAADFAERLGAKKTGDEGGTGDGGQGGKSIQPPSQRPRELHNGNGGQGGQPEVVGAGQLVVQRSKEVQAGLVPHLSR